MAFTGQQLVDDALAILGDPSGNRWQPADNLKWVNAAHREVMVFMPTANPVTVIKTPAIGTKQTLAGLGITDGIQFIKATRNFQSDGTTPARAITTAPLQWINETRPNWHSDPPDYAVHVLFDVVDPLTFWVWPPADGTKKIELVYSAMPAALGALASNCGLADVYRNAMSYYVLARMCTNAPNGKGLLDRATAYYQMFLQSLGVKDAKAKALDANRAALADAQGAIVGGQA